MTQKWKKPQTIGFVVFMLAMACMAVNGWPLDKIRIGMGAFSPTNSAIWVAESVAFSRSTA